jgi:phage gp16-like protein
METQVAHPKRHIFRQWPTANTKTRASEAMTQDAMSERTIEGKVHRKTHLSYVGVKT